MVKKIAGVLALPFLATPVFAQDIGIPSDISNTFQITDISTFIGAILQLMFIIAGILVFVFLVWGGVQWITSGGDKAQTQAARDRITAALVGLAIVALAYAITRLLELFFGFTIIGTTALPLPY
jgi:hypothetical protein